MLKKYNDQKLSEVLKDVMVKNKWKSKLYQTKVKEIWVKEMGVNVAQYTKEIKLRGKKIFLTISSASLRQDLSYEKDKIKDILNEGLGEAYIEDVVIR